MTGNHSLRAALALVVLLCGCATQSPPERGLSSAGLARIDKAISADVDRGRIPGVVMMVQRDGRLVYSKTIASRTRRAARRCRKDRFSDLSMTKPDRLGLADDAGGRGPGGTVRSGGEIASELKDEVGVEKDGNSISSRPSASRPSTTCCAIPPASPTGVRQVDGEGAQTKAGVDSDDTATPNWWRNSPRCRYVRAGTTWEYGRST